MFAHFVAAGDRIHLVIAIDNFIHAGLHDAFAVARKQYVPLAAPDNFDDIPASAAEAAFEFLNDFAVTAHRAIEALQVAVNNQYQIVEFFTRGYIDSA